MRYNRQAERSSSFGQRAETGPDVRKPFGIVRKSFANHEPGTITVEIVVAYETHGFEAEWDGFTVKTDLRGHIEQFLAEILEELFPRWSFELKKLETRKH